MKFAKDLTRRNLGGVGCGEAAALYFDNRKKKATYMFKQAIFYLCFIIENFKFTKKSYQR